MTEFEIEKTPPWPAAADRLPAEDPTVWLILYEESGISPEVFSGCGATEAAHRRFDLVRTGYNCHLFVRVATA